MPTYTPPVTRRTPPYEIGDKGPKKNLFRHFQGDPQADFNAYILEDGSVTGETPQTTYDSNGVVVQEATSRIEEVFYGGHVPVDVTPEELTSLGTIGFPESAYGVGLYESGAFSF